MLPAWLRCDDRRIHAILVHGGRQHQCLYSRQKMCRPKRSKHSLKALSMRCANCISSRDGETLVLVGQVSSFYHKQLAQEIVRQHAEGVEVVNSIHVRRSQD